MCISNRSSNSTNGTKNNNNSNQNEHVSNKDNKDICDKKCIEELENNSNDHMVNVGQLYEKEFKQHLLNIERKIDVLCKVRK